MNRFLAGTCALAFVLFGLGSAKAADEFKGFYVGANAGGAFGRFDVDTSPIFSPTGYFAATSTPAITAASGQKIKPNGFTAGGQAGYNWQWGDVVFGLECGFRQDEPEWLHDRHANISVLRPDGFHCHADGGNQLGVYGPSARGRGFWPCPVLWDGRRGSDQREVHRAVY